MGNTQWYEILEQITVVGNAILQIVRTIMTVIESKGKEGESDGKIHV